MITAERLRELLHYDPNTGEFRWRMAKKGTYAGAVAGRYNTDGDGYRQIGINRRLYKKHRLAWFYMTGAWPRHEIDHINGDRGDNRFCNLREATASENRRNMRKRVNNTSGYKGVSLDAERERASQWMARTNSLADRSPERARIAYIFAAWDHFGDFARVR
jgi:HNH endonuclease